jgi:HAD superfamily hydrolase (TIGR01509 family)
VIQYTRLEVGRVRAVLCDADGNLFPSEEPAFEVSTGVTNAFLDAVGADTRFTPEELRGATIGKNFRASAVDHCVRAGIGVDPSLRREGRAGDDPASSTVVLTPGLLEQWVAEEDRQVREHLARVLHPDPAVLDPLGRLAARFELAAVSSSGIGRLDACFTATGLTALIPAHRRFSAEDSLPTPSSKPDPAIYLLAARELAVGGAEALAVEDSVPGATSALAAGIPTVGNVMFVRELERPARIDALRRAGVAAVVTSWAELAAVLLAP